MFRRENHALHPLVSHPLSRVYRLVDPNYLEEERERERIEREDVGSVDIVEWRWENGRKKKRKSRIKSMYGLKKTKKNTTHLSYASTA